MAQKTSKKTVKTRDYLLVLIICGATKSGAHKDQKKAANRKACRKPVREEE